MNLIPEKFLFFAPILQRFHIHGGNAAAVYIYTDFKAVVREQAETSAKTAEILRTMDLRLSNLEHQTNK